MQPSHILRIVIATFALFFIVYGVELLAKTIIFGILVPSVAGGLTFYLGGFNLIFGLLLIKLAPFFINAVFPPNISVE